jgi:signal transduction histidine kinase
MGPEFRERPRTHLRFERAVEGQSIAGPGLGLYISRQIVAAHGGTISAKNEFGESLDFSKKGDILS